MRKPFLHWRDDWQLGLECLDDQHLELVNAINRLHRFVVHEDARHGNDRDDVCQHLSSLIEIARRHFKAEEALMQARGYPSLAGHRREHLMLLAELREYLREIESENKPFTLATLTALKHWQIDHALYNDRLFADFLKHLSPPENKMSLDATVNPNSARLA
ncbi:MAG: bacteriohemerythrin [Candidatus Thiodiazotropha sp.]